MNATSLNQLLESPVGQLGLLAVIIWSLVWKGAALWKAARRSEKGWFVAILVINTLGIFEILYLFLFSKMKPAHNHVGVEAV